MEVSLCFPFASSLGLRELYPQPRLLNGLPQPETEKELRPNRVSAIQGRKRLGRIIESQLRAKAGAYPTGEARQFPLIPAGERLDAREVRFRGNRTNGAISNNSSESRSVLSTRPQTQFLFLNSTVDSSR